MSEKKFFRRAHAEQKCCQNKKLHQSHTSPPCARAASRCIRPRNYGGCSTRCEWDRSFRHYLLSIKRQELTVPVLRLKRGVCVPVLTISRSRSVSLEKNAAHPVDKTQNRVQPRPAQGAVRQPWTMQRIPAANGRSRIICDSRRQYLVQKPLPLLSDDRIRESVFNEALAIPIERVVSGSANSELTRATYSRPNFGSLATRASVFFQSSKCRI